MKRTRIKPQERRAQLLDAATTVARKIGYNRMTRHDVAHAARVSPALISHYLGDMQALRHDVVEFAADTLDYPILCQAISLGDPIIAAVPVETRRAAIRHMLRGMRT